MSQQNLLRGFPLVSTAGSLLGPSRLVEASALIENALSYSQRYKRRHTTANSTLRVVNGGITTTSLTSPLLPHRMNISTRLYVLFRDNPEYFFPRVGLKMIRRLEINIPAAAERPLTGGRRVPHRGGIRVVTVPALSPD